MITPKDIEKKTMSPQKRAEAKNSYFAFYIGRPLSYVLTIPFLYAGISPNIVTMISIVCAFIGFVFLSFGTSIEYQLVGVFFFFLWNMGDGIDGNIMIWFVVASIRIHSRIGIVVLDGTAFKEMLTLFNKLLLEQMIFIMCITSFLEKMGFSLNIFKKISAVSAVGGVNMWKTHFRPVNKRVSGMDNFV